LSPPQALLQVLPSTSVLARVIGVVVLVATATADARDGQPIAVISADAAFTSALDDALVPAGMTVVVLGMRAAPSATELTTTSRALADEQHAVATVWLMPASGGATLVAYDRGVDRLLVRELPYRLPLGAAQAAEAARMVRTMLRALRVATDSENEKPPPVVPIEPPAPMFAAAIGGGLWVAPPGATSSVAGSLAVAWRPHGLGAALTATIAPAADVMAVSFDGRVRDVALGAEARYAIAFAPQVHVSPGAGMALHILSLAGSFGPGDLASRRFNPAVRLGVTATYALPRGLDVGLAVSADCLLRRQRYEVASEEILVVPRLQIVTGVLVGLRL
jgi:hypothetical protein